MNTIAAVMLNIMTQIVSVQALSKAQYDFA
jgi:hypothetical protein